MQFDATLNVAWLSLGLLALCVTARVAFRRNRSVHGPKWLRLVGVGLIVTALFPYISATDDVVRIDGSVLAQAAGHRQGSKKPTDHRQNDNLIRLFETMDAPLVCRMARLALTFCFIALVCTYAVRGLDRNAPQTAGRSPPQLATA